MTSDDSDKTVQPVIIKRSMSEPGLVILDGEELGRWFMLQSKQLIGRNVGVEIYLRGDESLSREHASIEERDGSYFLQDLNSSYGTFVNDSRIEEWRLSHGDLIRVGSTTLRFLSEDIEGAYHEQIYHMVTVDRISGLAKKSNFLQELEGTLFQRAVRGAYVLLQIENLKEINDSRGEPEGDRVLATVGRAIEDSLSSGDFAGRLTGIQMGIYLSQIEKDGALDWATELIAKVQAEQVEHLPRFLIGVVSISDLRTSLVRANERVDSTSLFILAVYEVLSAAESALYAASRLGLDQVVLFEGPTKFSGIWRRESSKRDLAAQIKENPGGFKAVLACEIKGEKKILREGGARLWEEWSRDLINVVSTVIDQQDLYACRKGRGFTFVALHSSSKWDVESFQAAVQEGFLDTRIEDLFAAEERIIKTEKLAFSTLSGMDLVGLEEKDLDRLLGLLAKGDDLQRLLDELPYPISALYTMPSALASSYSQVSAFTDFFDVSLRFLTALGLSLNLNRNGEESFNEMAELFSSLQGRGRSPTTGTWKELAFRLAKLLPKKSTSAAHRVVRSLVNEKNKASELYKVFSKAVEVRNRVVHDRTKSEEAYTLVAQELREKADFIFQAMSPLRETRLVSVEQMEFKAQHIDYKLRLYKGPRESFPIIAENKEERLLKSWCYLIDSDDSALCLSPFLLADFNEKTDRVEPFLAENVSFDPETRRIKAKSLIASHEKEFSLEATMEIQAFSKFLNQKMSAKDTKNIIVPAELQEKSSE